MCTAYKLIHDIKVGSGDVEINGKLWDLKIPGKVGHFVDKEERRVLTFIWKALLAIELPT